MKLPSRDNHCKMAAPMQRCNNIMQLGVEPKLTDYNHGSSKI